MKIGIAHKLPCIGMALTVVGVPWGMCLTYFMPSIKMSYVLMIASIFCITSFKNLVRMKFPSFNRLFGIILLFQIMAIIYYWFSDAEREYIRFQYFLVALVIAYSSLDKEKDYSTAVKAVFILSSLGVGLACYLITKGLLLYSMTMSSELWVQKQSETLILEIFTLMIFPVVNIASGMALSEKSKWVRCFKIAIYSADVYLLLVSTKRTPVLVAVVMAMVFFYQKDVYKDLFLWKPRVYLKIVAGFGILSLVYMLSKTVSESVNRFVYNFASGLMVFFGDMSVSDSTGSAAARVYSRQFMTDYIENEFDIFNYIFGGGYMIKWLDAPILQAYLDMGVLGFIVYFFLIVYLPIKTILKRASNNLQMMALLLTVHAFVSGLNSGHPYQYLKWTPLCLLALTFGLKAKKDE
jgi:hypothetical protein